MNFIEKIKIFVNFIFFRGIVYLLSFISYNTTLFNLKKIIEIIKEKDLMNLIKKIDKYQLKIICFFSIILLILLGYKFLIIKIREARENSIKIITIKKNEPENLILYIGTYLLPSLGAYYRLSLLWLLIYEVFLFIIYCRHINFHYKILLGFLYSSYVVIDENQKEFILYTNKKINNIEDITEEKIIVNFLNFGVDYWEEDILFYNDQ